MELLTHQLLDESTTYRLRRNLLSDKNSWQEGIKTAGSHAAKVKNNLQLDRSSSTSEQSSKEIIEKMKSDQLVKSFSIPNRFHGVMFSRSGQGQSYGFHIDNPYMSTGRSDLSFTLFLSDPDSYEGGELCIQSVQDCQKIKLGAGQIVIYPSTSLHAVEQVNSGERLVCVGWIQSYVRSNEDRSILFSLEAGAKSILAKHGSSPELDLIFQSYSNLLRRLGD